MINYKDKFDIYFFIYKYKIIFIFRYLYFIDIVKIIITFNIIRRNIFSIFLIKTFIITFHILIY